MKKIVIAIVGPTAVGKTALSLEVAKKLSGEIISGDSMQVYKGMDIGTDKIRPEQMQGIPHYMLNIKEPKESFSVADFQKQVRYYIDYIHAKNKLPIIVGGSGLYVQAVLYDYSFTKAKRNIEYTKKLEEQVTKEGIEPLYEKLQQIDPEQATKIHPNNHRRVIRALEIYETTGKTMSEHHREQQNTPLYDHHIVGLTMKRQILYERINKRVDEMVETGLVEEVKSLYLKGYEHTEAMRGIGYKEFIPYFKNEKPLQDCVEDLKRNTRRYAKRQFTWFKNKMDVKWYNISPDVKHEVYEKILTDLAGIV
ncbi:MAG TPA: tRNA (adenosine(37)-N6)-dimethylallyltransferase MiaA [Bacillota bacterium]|nr:tRNA (adenosine(37)-N6)-dimethylallyltransferase MiaA [Bacillota bacterium]